MRAFRDVQEQDIPHEFDEELLEREHLHLCGVLFLEVREFLREILDVSVAFVADFL